MVTFQHALNALGQVVAYTHRGTGQQAAAATDLGDHLGFRIGEVKAELTNAPRGGGRFLKCNPVRPEAPELV